MVVLLYAPLVFSQNTEGKVYANNEVLEDAYVQNITQGEAEFTSKTGDFSIKAVLGDSLVFSAPFYVTQKFVVERYQLDKVWVVELKENLNQLDEVRLSDTSPKKIDLGETSSSLLKSFKEDYKANPGKYGSGPSGNVGWMVNKVTGLFKKEKKENPDKIVYEELEDLFENDPLFTHRLLSRQLEIPEEHHNLFLEFCSTKNMDDALLDKDQQFQLLDHLVDYSKEFRDFLNKEDE